MELSLLCGVDVLLLVSDKTAGDSMIYDSDRAQECWHELPLHKSHVVCHSNLDVSIGSGTQI